MVVSVSSDTLAKWTPCLQEEACRPSGPSAQLSCQKEVLGSTHSLMGPWQQMSWPISSGGNVLPDGKGMGTHRATAYSLSWLPQCPRWRGQRKKRLLIHVQGSVDRTTWLLSNHHRCHRPRHPLWHLYNLVLYQTAIVYVVVLFEAQIPALMELGQIELSLFDRKLWLRGLDINFLLRPVSTGAGTGIQFSFHDIL